MRKMYKHFQTRVKELMEQKGLSERELARELQRRGCDVSFGTINRFSHQKGDNTGWQTIAALADYFHVSTDYLMGRADSPAVKTGDASGAIHRATRTVQKALNRLIQEGKKYEKSA